MLQNIGFSLAIIAVLIPLAATGVLGLATVVFVHELAEVLVIGNAIRAARTTRLPDLAAAPEADACDCCAPTTPEPNNCSTICRPVTPSRRSTPQQ